MRVWLTEFRRSPQRWVWFLYTGLFLLTVVTGKRPGVALWSDLSWGLNEGSALVNPIVAGLFALQAARRVRDGGEERSNGSARTPLAPLAIQFTASAAWVLLGALSALGVVAIGASQYHAYGVPIWTWLGATVAGTMASAAIGFAIGIVTRARWWVAPITAVVFYITWNIIAGPLGLPRTVVQLYPTALNGTDPFVRYITTTPVGQSLWYVGLIALLALIVTSRRRTGLRNALLLLPVAALTVLGVSLVAVTNGQFTTGYNSRDYSCRRGTPVICVNPAYAAGLPALQRTFQRFNSRVDGSDLVATRLEQQVGGIGDDPSAGSRSLYLEDLGADFTSQTLASYVQTYAGSEKCTSADSMIAHQIVDAWLVGSGTDFVQAQDEIGVAARRFKASSADTKRAWLIAHYDRVISCKITPRALP